MTAARHGAGCICTGCDDLRAMTAPLAPNVPDPAPVTVRTPTDPAAAQGGRTTAEWIADLAKARQAAEAEVERLQQVSDGYEVFVREVSPRLLAAEAKLSRVEDVARFPRITSTAGGTSLVYVNHTDIRAALADATSPSGLDDDATTEPICGGEYDTDARPACGSSCVERGD